MSEIRHQTCDDSYMTADVCGRITVITRLMSDLYVVLHNV